MLDDRHNLLIAQELVTLRQKNAALERKVSQLEADKAAQATDVEAASRVMGLASVIAIDEGRSKLLRLLGEDALQRVNQFDDVSAFMLRQLYQSAVERHKDAIDQAGADSVAMIDECVAKLPPPPKGSDPVVVL